MLTVVSTTHYDTNRCEAQCLCCGKKCAFPYTTATFVCVECVDKKTRVVTVDLLGQQTIQFVVSPIESAESALSCLSKKFSAAIKDASQFALQGFDSLNWRIVQRDQGESPQEVHEPQEIQRPQEIQKPQEVQEIVEREVEARDIIQNHFISDTAKDNLIEWRKNHSFGKHIDWRLLYGALARREAWFLKGDYYQQVYESIGRNSEAVFSILCETVPHGDEQCQSTLDYFVRHTRFIRRLTKHLGSNAVSLNITYNVRLRFLNLNATFEHLDGEDINEDFLNDMLIARSKGGQFNIDLNWDTATMIHKLRTLACTRLLPSEMIAARLCDESPNDIDTVALLRAVSRNKPVLVTVSPTAFKNACDNFVHHYKQGSFVDACASRVTQILLEKSQRDPLWYVGSSESWQFVKHYAAWILRTFEGLIDKITRMESLKHYHGLLEDISAARTRNAVAACFDNFSAPEPAHTPRKAPKAKKSKKTKRDRSASPPPKKDKNKRSASPAPKRVPQKKVEPVTDPVQLKAGVQEQICATVQAINVLEDELRMFGGKFAKHSHDEPVNDVYRDQYELNDPEVRARQILEQEKAQKARDLAIVHHVHPEIIKVRDKVTAEEQERLRKEAEKQEQERKRKEAEEQERLRKANIESLIDACVEESERLQKARAQCEARSNLGKVIERLNEQMRDCEHGIGRNTKLIASRRQLLSNMDADDADMKEDFDKYTAQLAKYTADGDRLAAEFNALQSMLEKAENDLKDATANDDIFPVITLEDLKRQEEAVKKELQELNEQLRQFN